MNNIKSTTDKAVKERLIKWVNEEISRGGYTPKQTNAMLYLAKKGKKQEILKIMLKVHNLPFEIPCCYCQKEASTWQEKVNKAQLFLQLSEREFNRAEKLRIKETTHLLNQQFRQQHE